MSFFVYFHSFVLATFVARYLGGVLPTDVVYLVLPLYHSSAGMLSLGPSFLFGVSVAIRAKFSASKFWSDCVRYNCTVRKYVLKVRGDGVTSVYVSNILLFYVLTYVFV